MRRRDFVACLLCHQPLLARLSAQESESISPSTADLRRRLSGLAQQGPATFLIGQNIGSSNHEITAGYRQYFAALPQLTGRWPAVLSVDYGYNAIGPGIGETNRLVIEHARQGGLATISFHPPNPWRNTTCNDTKSGSLAELLQSGTAVNRRWLGMLDHVADGLNELQRAGVSVLWRPLHEMNGDWFWWSRTEQQPLTPAQFQRLWRYVYQHLTATRRLENLLWVYSPSAQYAAQQRPVGYYFPGERWVDIVGVDYYGDPFGAALRRSLRDLTEFHKPLAICEFGFSQDQSRRCDNRQLLRALQQHAVPVQYVVYWHSWSTTRVAIIDHDHAAEFLQDAHVITREMSW